MKNTPKQDRLKQAEAIVELLQTETRQAFRAWTADLRYLWE